MLIGAMNNPHKNLATEIARIKKNFDFVDLTLEMPKAMPDSITPKIFALLKDVKTVGHTGWYLPIGSPFPELRSNALAEFEKCLKAFRKLGAEYVNVHFDESLPFLKPSHVIDSNVWTLRKMVVMGKRYGINVMAENTPGMFSDPKNLGIVFRKVPKLLLHLDIAHANIGFKTNQTLIIMKRFEKKIVHVHASDNNGKTDSHLGMGKGNVRWKEVLGTLKHSGYDGTITLEVFNEKQRLQGKKKLRKLWDEL